MPKKDSDAIKGARMTSITTIVVAVVGLIGTLAVAYWQFVLKPPSNIPSSKVVYYGRVIDINSNIHISNAKVALYLDGAQQITYTDSEGVYQFILNVNSDVNGLVVVEAPGYEIYSRNIVVSSNIRTLEDIRVTQQKIVLTPTVDVSFPATAVPTDTPQPTITPEVSDVLVDMIDNYYGCINDATHNKRDDYIECWNLLSNKPGEYQENLKNMSGGLESFITFWNAYKISYNLYYCPKGNDRFVDAEYYLYEWGDLSKPHSRNQLILEFSFALDESGWRIKGGKEFNNKVSSYCEDQPRVIRPVPSP